MSLTFYFTLLSNFVSDGTLFSWGNNDCGQLGLGSDFENCTIISQPTVLKALIGVPIAFIACGGYHSFAITKSGKNFHIFSQFVI